MRYSIPKFIGTVTSGTVVIVPVSSADKDRNGQGLWTMNLFNLLNVESHIILRELFLEIVVGIDNFVLLFDDRLAFAVSLEQCSLEVEL